MRKGVADEDDGIPATQGKRSTSASSTMTFILLQSTRSPPGVLLLELTSKRSRNFSAQARKVSAAGPERDDLVCGG